MIAGGRCTAWECPNERRKLLTSLALARYQGLHFDAASISNIFGLQKQQNEANVLQRNRYLLLTVLSANAIFGCRD